MHNQKWRTEEVHIGTILLLHFPRTGGHACSQRPFSLPSPPLLSTHPKRSRRRPNFHFLQRSVLPSFLSNQRSLPLSLAPSDGMNVEGEGRGNNGFVKFLRDKIRSYHIGWGAPAVVRGRRKRGEGGRVPDRNGPYNSGYFERKRSSKSRQS